MSLVGFAPLLDGCAVCGEEDPAEPVLDIRGGVLRCRRCSGDSALSLTPGALAAMRHVVYGEAKRLYSFTLPPEDQRRMSLAAEAYVRAMLERDFRTLAFYKSICAAEAGRPPEG